MGCASSKPLDSSEVQLEVGGGRKGKAAERGEAERELQAATQGADTGVLAKALVRARTAGVEQRQVEAGARKLQELMVVATVGAASASTAAPEFEYLTPMLVMPFAQFKRQGRIMKSVAKWRDEALREGWLVEFDKDSRKIVIFVSHT